MPVLSETQFWSCRPRHTLGLRCIVASTATNSWNGGFTPVPHLCSAVQAGSGMWDVAWREEGNINFCLELRNVVVLICDVSLSAL